MIFVERDLFKLKIHAKTVHKGVKDHKFDYCKVFYTLWKSFHKNHKYDTAHWGLIQPQLSGAYTWVGFFESLKHVKISYNVIEFRN